MELSTFQKFQDAGLAREFALRLEEAGIPCFLEDENKFFDVSFANNPLTKDINLKIRPADFVKARRTLEDFYAPRLDEVEPDYYLFSFTSKELEEIIAKPDEWGVLDYLLAQKLLNERGRDFTPEKIEALKSERIQVLAKPKTIHPLYLVLYYLLAVLVYFIGIFLGSWLLFAKTTLPNGEKVFSFTKGIRNHGLAMMIIGGIFLMLAVFSTKFLYGFFALLHFSWNNSLN